jgi:hypothetical protein
MAQPDAASLDWEITIEEIMADLDPGWLEWDATATAEPLEPVLDAPVRRVA